MAERRGQKGFDVFKFGGAALRSPQGFKDLERIIGARNGESTVVVISALGSVTRDLEEAARAAEDGQIELARSIVESISGVHSTLAKDCGLVGNAASLFHHELQEMERRVLSLLRGVSITRECSPRTLDLVLSFGEQLAVSLVRHFLGSTEIKTVFLDAAECIVTNDNHGAAKPAIELSTHRIQRRVPDLIGKTVVTQGFVGKTEAGQITTMGRESSNLSAAIFTLGFDAQSLVIVTDVPGICTTDPKRVPEARTIAELSYTNAKTLASLGLKLIYPGMVDLLEKAAIPISVVSAEYPKEAGTIIHAKEGSETTSVNGPKLLVTQESHNRKHNEGNRPGRSQSLPGTLVTGFNIKAFDVLAAVQRWQSKNLERQQFSIEIASPDVFRALVPDAEATQFLRFFHEQLVVNDSTMEN